MRFEIDSKILKDFFEKVRQEEFNIKITSTAWNITCVETDILLTNAVLNKSAFSTYQEITEEKIVTIESKQKLLSFLGRFSEKIAIEIDGLYFKMATEKRHANSLLGREELIGKIDMPAKVNYEKGFTVKVDMLKEAVKNSELLKIPILQFVTKNSEFKIISKSTTDNISEIAKVDYPDHTSSFGPLVGDIVKPLSGDVKIGFEDDGILVVTYSDKYSKIIYLLPSMNVDEMEKVKDDEPAPETKPPKKTKKEEPEKVAENTDIFEELKDGEGAKNE